MRIDQRNAGAVMNMTGASYGTCDRWAFDYSANSKFTAQQNAGSVTPPAGFSNYLGVTSSSAYSVVAGDYFLLRQTIEGYNIADLGFGTANAKTITLSFWVRSSLTGTFGGAVNNGGSYSYPISYSILAANTWEYKTIIISGATAGTWASNNTTGMNVLFSLGTGSTYTTTANSWVAGNYANSTGATSVVGTNGATFYITGVQLEPGTVATPFERRSYGAELALAQRYFEKSYTMSKLPGSTTDGICSGANFLAVDTSSALGTATFKASKRAIPTVTVYGPTSGAAGNARNAGNGADTAVSGVNDITENGFFRFSGSWTPGITYSTQYIASAEL
jgi:hypothetical protein